MNVDYENENHLFDMLRNRSAFLVCIGSGVMCMEWKNIMSQSAHGTALRMEWTPQGQPSRTTLRALLGITKNTECQPKHSGMQGQLQKATDVIFLQNYSSMVPVALLVEHLSSVSFRRAWTHNGDAARGTSAPCCTVLDACAAPGGKTSLLLSLLQERAEEERTAKAEAISSLSSITEPFRVVCCERSRPRLEQLVNLIHHHFATEPALPSASPSWSADSADNVPFVTRVVEFHCVDTNKFLKRKLTDVAGSCGGSVASHTESFDAVLLDPPCTGMGLRPKLMPHMHSIASIQESSDYQRKLFDSCLHHIRGSPKVPGVLVYSTCTTTLEENEANVLHFLRTYPSLLLARATTPTQRALCNLSVVRRYGSQKETDGGQSSSSPCSFLLQKEITEVQVAKERAAASEGLSSTDPLLLLRFMPRPPDAYDDTSEDSVGFFVAVFLWRGYTGA
ncbi:hypothetical protein JKF63_04656 [Porcisia hertigi]|uniref:SAM-dependent MTase RsmB/NOP-type domain-containing protein n=1 Tax=Porcisia hertigi TaxID=2761500 RepID=A0A836IT67_9TRYP|nr:hypothetical protein JKF63_04656 [Porcisia hertigi]